MKIVNAVIDFAKAHPKKTVTAVASLIVFAGAPEGAVMKIAAILSNLFM